MKKNIFIFLVIIFASALYGYTQFTKKGLISAVLLHEVNLENPPSNIFAISTSDQNLTGGKSIPKGTRFTGSLTKGDSSVIYFNAIQIPDGKQEQILAKAVLTSGSKADTPGVSSKISKTLYKQTRTNVLGAIFKDQDTGTKPDGYILPKGTIIKIEAD